MIADGLACVPRLLRRISPGSCHRKVGAGDGTPPAEAHEHYSEQDSKAPMNLSVVTSDACTARERRPLIDGHMGDWLARQLMHGQSGAVSLHRTARASAARSARPAGRGVIQDDREFLAQSNLLRLLPADERDTLIAHAHVHRYAADETIFLMGSTGDSMMVVLSGHVRISVASPAGREIMLAILVPGEIFGEIAMLDSKERTTNARAASECRLAILYRRDVLAFLEKHPKAWPRLLSTLCDRLRSADERMAEIALMSPPVRLAKALLRMTAIEPQTGKHLSQVRLTQREIGGLIGATRETVNKWLGCWQRMGILQIAESLITIANRNALEDLAQLESYREVCCDPSLAARRSAIRRRAGHSKVAT